MDTISSAWRRTAKSRLRFELAGLALACQKGLGPQGYAQHLWGKGARRWMGKAMPSASEYLLKEAQALRQLYPEVCFSIEEAEDDWAQLVFREGCLGGWGKNPWALAASLGLMKEEVCAYCQEAFSVWAEQIGLRAFIGPDGDESCRLVVIKE